MANQLSSAQTSPGFFRSVYDGAIIGDYSENPTVTKTVTQIGTGLIPVAGQLADLRDTSAAIRNVVNGKPGGWGDLGFAAAGWIPFAGDLLKSVRKIGFKRTVSTIGNAVGSPADIWRTITLLPDNRWVGVREAFKWVRKEAIVRFLPKLGWEVLRELKSEPPRVDSVQGSTPAAVPLRQTI